VKDIDSKIPKDLKSMKEDLRQRYSKLKFMINEYYEHYNTTSDNRKLSKYYLDKSAQTLKRLTNLHLRTDEEAELKKLEDEK
jgi:RNA polymerase-binding transcription factor DksA